MSTGPKTSLENMIANAKELMQRWDRPSAHLEIVGSVRRGVQMVGDLDFIAAHPGKDARRDELFEAIEAMKPGHGALFGGPMGYPQVIGLRGLKFGFRMCEVRVQFVEKAEALPVQIHRYDPGDRGNYGWVKIMRTGPLEFGKWLLWQHHRNNHLPESQKAADQEPGGGTYLRDQWGKPIPTPTEERAFAVAGVPFVAPERRREEAGARC